MMPISRPIPPAAPLLRIARRLVLLVLAALLPAACARLTGVDGDAVTAVARAEGIVATNRAGVPAVYLAYSPEWLALVNLVDCSRPVDTCPRIPARSTITIPWSEVGGFGTGTGLYVLGWSLDRTPRTSGRVELAWPPQLP